MSRTSFKLWGLSSTMRISSFATTHRDREGERRPHADLALDPDPPTVQLDELPTERQPEPRALYLFVPPPPLPKLLEHRLLVFRGDADAGIADCDFDQSVLCYSCKLDAP